MTSSAQSDFSAGPVETTGRLVMVLSDDVRGDDGAVSDALRSVAPVTSIASTRDFTDGAVDAAAMTADATIFAQLGIAVVTAEPGQRARIEAAAEADPRVLAVEPEHILHALTEAPAPPRDTEFLDTDSAAWGLDATGVLRSARTGKGVRVAVLDTGFDFDHPDFAGRAVVSQSFVTDEEAQDGQGHGTHCIGTSCGPLLDGAVRYGVAHEAEIFVGKVLSNAGSGTDAEILAGMDWAISNGCRIISMSLGADVRAVSRAYEIVGRRALDAGTLIVAAAGNNANRTNGNQGFVGIPANSPSIMAVAAVDSRLAVANFSAASNPVKGGKVDIAGPGVKVFSSWPMPTRTRSISGTSMATPHVAGIAALWAEATGATGRDLWWALERNARKLTLPAGDVGVGLAQAPR